MNIPLFQFPPSLESEVATRGHAQTYPQMQHHYDDPGAFPPFSQASDDAPHLVHTRHPHPYGMNTHFSGGAPFRHVASDPAGGPSSRASEVDAYAPDDAPRYSAYDPTYGSSFASVPRALASPHVPQFSQDVRQREYVHASVGDRFGLIVDGLRAFIWLYAGTDPIFSDSAHRRRKSRPCGRLAATRRRPRRPSGWP
ncbi:hypothetical protein C8Q77DRAFT_758465 [Trametes polyzona]|nr:hypothetical protein C8Q77DRAFT_758465 [Trametes polyzona]